MKVKIVHNSNEAYEFLKRKSPFDYIYQYNDLASDVWPYVICYGLYEQDELMQIAMLITDMEIPVLLAASYDHQEENAELIRQIKPLLPPRFYTHIDHFTLENVFLQAEISELEEYMNMGLATDIRLNQPQPQSPTSGKPVRLSTPDLPKIKELLANSYPEAWLDDELVQLEKNFGIYHQDQLISFAGIHAYSEEYQVAAVAHVTTLPEYRQQGYSKQVLTALISDLQQKIQYIGLNVKAHNHPAIKCYRKLGFEESGRFVACVINNKI